MNIIQTYFNRNVEIDNISWKDNYLTPECHWLSIAYSCLLLKKYNPTKPLIFYGNEAVVRLFADILKLPYDNFVIQSNPSGVKELLYCYPKIETYSQQNAPFIHVDCDVFIKEEISKTLLTSNLVAQHRELDVTFYGKVYNHLIKYGVQLPQYFIHSISNEGIKSFNAGILGGNNIGFISKYIEEFCKLVSNNEKILKRMDNIFLMNVVFEQWLYYSLSSEMNEEVSTYYSETIKNFIMPNGGVKNWIYDDNVRYLHVMEHKHDYQVNKYIISRMQNEFENDYERIIRETHKRIDIPRVFALFDGEQKRNKETTTLFETAKSFLISKKIAITNEIECFLNNSIESFSQFLNSNSYLTLQKIRNNPTSAIHNLETGYIRLSPLMKYINITEANFKDESNYKANNYYAIAIVYNIFYEKNDFLFLNKDLIELINLIGRGVYYKELLELHPYINKEEYLMHSLKISLFNGIIIIDYEED